MRVRKRIWTTKEGVERSAFVVFYVDQNGQRRNRAFQTKREATDYSQTIGHEILQGTHTPASASISVAEAGAQWLDTCAQHKLERTTIDGYRQALDYHILPFLGRVKLSRLTVPAIRDFEDRLLRGDPAPGEVQGKKRSRAMVQHIRVALGALLADAQERGLVAKNPVRDMRRARNSAKKDDPEARRRGKLRVGEDIPSPDEIRRIIGALDGVSKRYRVMILTAIFTGLRASELRGLHWKDVDFEKSELHVTQRADRYNKIGAPKSAAGSRSVPLTPQLLQALREWRMETGRRGLVFGTGTGQPDAHGNILNRSFFPAQMRAGVTKPQVDEKGKPCTDESGQPILIAKYSLHALRHFFASWCINRKADGGLELPLKVVQVRLGHSSIAMTGDVYGHLFPSGDDAALLAGAEAALWA